MPKALDDELVMNLVELALSQTAEARQTFIRTACGDDTELFTEVWEYVTWSDRMRDFLLEPLIRVREHRFEPGDLLADRFRILRQVSQGGMGVVYEAKDQKLHRRIALKCAKSGFSRRLPPEVRHASEISHPNVCKIFEIHTASTPSGDIDFLTMEFLDGETLAARLGRGVLPGSDALEIARQICAGLAEAHRNGVVHGDLKPNNVILTSDAEGRMRAVITDFGLARKPLAAAAGDFANGAAGLGASRAAGTPEYMAPELWKGVKQTAASDVYALGVVLSQLAPAGRWRGVVEQCLEADPARRYLDAGEVGRAIEPSRTLRWWLAAAAAILLAAVSGLVTFQRATAPRDTIRLAMLPVEAAPDLEALAAGVSRDASAELARLKGGKRARLKIVAPSDSGATQVVHARLARENGRVVLHASVTDPRSHANSADWQAAYAPGDVHYAGKALAGFVTATLRLAPPAVDPVKPQAAADYRAGLAYTRRNSTVDKALPLLQHAVAADPGSPLTWAALAEAQWFKYFVTKDPAWLDRTSESLRQAQSRNPDLAPVHIVAGLLRANAGAYEQAETEYERAIELEPANSDAYRRLGQVYLRSDRVDRALAPLEKAVELSPDDFKVYQDLGTYYRSRGDLPQTARLFEKCVALAPDESDSHYILGTVYMDQNRFAEAERELRRAIALQSSPIALNNLGLTLIEEDKSNDAIPFLVQASAGLRDQYLGLMNLGTAYRRSNQKDAARQAYERGLALAEQELALNPRDGLIRSRVAFLCAHLGDRARAESEIRQALQLAPEDADVRDNAVDVYEAIGQRDTAFEILRNSPDSVLMAAIAWPDLADLRKDSRFQQLAASHHIK